MRSAPDCARSDENLPEAGSLVADKRRFINVMRLAERRTFSKPLVEKLKVWFEQQLSRAPRRGKCDTLCADAVG
jgi:hypothetical protein